MERIDRKCVTGDISKGLKDVRVTASIVPILCMCCS